MTRDKSDPENIVPILERSLNQSREAATVTVAPVCYSPAVAVYVCLYPSPNHPLEYCD